MKNILLSFTLFRHITLALCLLGALSGVNASNTKSPKGNKDRKIATQYITNAGKITLAPDVPMPKSSITVKGSSVSSLLPIWMETIPFPVENPLLRTP